MNIAKTAALTIAAAFVSACTAIGALEIGRALGKALKG